PRLEVLKNAIEYLSLDFNQLRMHRIDLLDEDRLHPLRAVTDPRSFLLINNQVAALQDAHTGASQCAPWILSRHPVEMHGHLGPVAHQGILIRSPDLPIRHTRPRRFDLSCKRKLDDLHRLGQRINLFPAFNVADFREQRSRIVQFRMRKRLADLLPCTVEDRPFRRSRSLDFTQAGDTNPAALDVQLLQSLHNDSTVVASGLAHIAGPVLHRRPAGRGGSCDGGNFSLQWKNGGGGSIPAPAHVGEITGVSLVVGRMTAVLGSHDDIKPLLTHQLAHRVPAPISLGNRKPGIGIKFSHKNDSALWLVTVDFFDYSRAPPVTIT